MGEMIKDESKYKPPADLRPWLTFEEGTTTIRLLSHSYSFRSHYIRSENKSYDCVGVVKCKWCQEGDPPKQRWAYLVLVRGDESYVKALEIGWSIFETILELAKDKDYGDPRSFDLKITRKGKGRKTNYTVIPGKDTKFTDKEKLILRPQKLDDPAKADVKLMGYYSKQEDEDDGENKPEESDVPF